MEKDNLYKEINITGSKSANDVLTAIAKNKNATAIQARILWPALGFPAVISPRENAPEDTITNSDATRCICILLLSDKPTLSPQDVSKHLRIVNWKERNKRYITEGENGSFTKHAITVISERTTGKLIKSGLTDKHGFGISFGGDGRDKNAITVKFADYVNNFYTQCGLKYLYEIRISEHATHRMVEGQYHIFWNSEMADITDRPSDEMNLLLQKYARPKREKVILDLEAHLKKLKDDVSFFDTHNNGQTFVSPDDYKKMRKEIAYYENVIKFFKSKSKFFLQEEYEFEYGSKPETTIPQIKREQPTRTEILHPIFIRKAYSKQICVGHLTDMHVSTRENVFEKNLKNSDKYSVEIPIAKFNNWNTSFIKGYKKAKDQKTDILLFTGDLIDYGRGHLGYGGQLGDDRFYHEDRNWFLFYSLLAANDCYSKPVFTILGNHDWRLNPYPTNAFVGAPGPSAFFHNHIVFDLNKNEGNKTKLLLEEAHGKYGLDRMFSYYGMNNMDFIDYFFEKNGLLGVLKKFGEILVNTKKMNVAQSPVETNIESVGWYLMAINPFLDYSFSLPNEKKILMLDWAEDENLLFKLKRDGDKIGYAPWDYSEATNDGPKAANCLTSVQQKMTEDFINSEARGKIIGIHAPPIGPYPYWSNQELSAGKKTYDPKEIKRGPSNFATRTENGKVTPWNGHPFYAIKPTNIDHPYGVYADYNSIDSNRDWFIKNINDPQSGISAVLSGHIHRNGIFQVLRYDSKNSKQPLFADQYLIKSHYHIPNPFNYSSSDQYEIGMHNLSINTPLFINTTSSGPRGVRRDEKKNKSEPNRTVDPGLAIIDLGEAGKIERIKFISSL